MVSLPWAEIFAGFFEVERLSGEGTHDAGSGDFLWDDARAGIRDESWEPREPIKAQLVPDVCIFWSRMMQHAARDAAKWVRVLRATDGWCIVRGNGIFESKERGRSWRKKAGFLFCGHGSIAGSIPILVSWRVDAQSCMYRYLTACFLCIDVDNSIGLFFLLLFFLSVP